jgi:hypothetical protein
MINDISDISDILKLKMNYRRRYHVITICKGRQCT